MSGLDETPAAGSPLDRLRTTYEARQQSRTLDVPLWEDGQLVARVGLVGTTGARDAMRTMMRLLTNEAGDLTEEDVAGVIAAATQGLYARGDSNVLEPLRSADGSLLRFDGPEFGAAIGQEHVTTPVGAVLVAFTEGSPPTVNAMRMVAAATRIASWLAQGEGDAEDVVEGH